MNKSAACEVGHLRDETVTALTVVALNEWFLNVDFEAVDMADGTYRIMVVSKYDRAISNHTLKMFQREMFTYYRVIASATDQLRKQGLLNDR